MRRAIVVATVAIALAVGVFVSANAGGQGQRLPAANVQVRDQPAGRRAGVDAAGELSARVLLGGWGAMRRVVVVVVLVAALLAAGGLLMFSGRQVEVRFHPVPAAQ